MKKTSKSPPLMSFDPAAFMSSGEYSQELCDTILGLALIYNDIKGTMNVIDVLLKTLPAGTYKPNKEWGEYCGRDSHVFRYHAGQIWELMMFIEKNQTSISDPKFALIISKMSKKAREAWKALVDASLENRATGTVGKTLLRIRHKISFHYDAEEIGKGYQRHFFSSYKDQPAYVSLGSNMTETRFFFADAAVQDYIKLVLGTHDLVALHNEVKRFTRCVNEAISELIHNFLTQRGFAYKVEMKS